MRREQATTKQHGAPSRKPLNATTTVGITDLSLAQSGDLLANGAVLTVQRQQLVSALGAQIGNRQLNTLLRQVDATGPSIMRDADDTMHIDPSQIDYSDNDASGDGGIVDFNMQTRIVSEIAAIYFDGDPGRILNPDGHGSSVRAAFPWGKAEDIKSIKLVFKSAGDIGDSPIGGVVADGEAGGAGRAAAGDEYNLADESEAGATGNATNDSDSSTFEDLTKMDRGQLVDMVKEERDKKPKHYYFIDNRSLSNEKRFTEAALKALYKKMYAATDDADISDVSALFSTIKQGKFEKNPTK